MDPKLSEPLFYGRETAVSARTLFNALTDVGAFEAATLFVHSAMTFGNPNPNLQRGEILDRIIKVMMNSSLKSLLMPTFTFSFCNGEDFDVRRSRSPMGALNERFRQTDGVVRSAEPLMSVALWGDDRDLINDLGDSSIGHDSTYDRLAQKENVKFLFLGTELGACFTFMHYLEWVARVPYRYEREFRGLVTDSSGTHSVSKRLFVRYQGVEPNSASFEYGKLLEERGDLKTAQVGDARLSCVSLEVARDQYLKILGEDPNYFIEGNFSRDQVSDQFVVRNMTAL